MAFGNSKKIIILGSKGNLGQELLKVFLADEKYEVIGWDIEEINITNEDEVAVKISEVAPQIIINAAAYNAVDKCEEPEEFEIAKKINGEAVKFLAKTARKIGAVLIHYSIGYVFDGFKKDGYKEDDLPKPISRYGESKYLGEKYLQENIDNYYLIRTSRIFGQKGASGVSKESFIDAMLRVAQGKKHLEVVDEELDNFTYAPDLAMATKNLIESKASFGTYHITNKGVYSWYQAAIKIFSAAGIDIDVIPVAAERFPRPAKRPKCSALLNTKLSSLRSFEEALNDYLAGKKIL